LKKAGLREIGASKPRVSKKFFRNIQFDTALGMFFSQLISFFIIATVGTTLSVSEITSAAQAAAALKPVAGEWAFLLFALGIISTGLLAVPILAGSGAFAVAEAAEWKVGSKRSGIMRRDFMASSFLRRSLDFSLISFLSNRSLFFITLPLSMASSLHH
jgi:Mn2+/Fe2+ NRAMP family transporter